MKRLLIQTKLQRWNQKNWTKSIALQNQFSDESIKPPSRSDEIVDLKIKYNNNAKTQVKFNRSCLKWEKLVFTHKTTLNFHIVFERNLLPINPDSKFPLFISLFGAVKFTKSADCDKYSYSGHSVGFY